MRFLFWSLNLALAIACIVFTVHNQDHVSMDLWPFPYLITLPLNLFAIILLFGGILCGAGLIWLSHMALHKKIFQLKRKNRILEQQHQELADKLEKAENQLIALEATEKQFAPSALAEQQLRHKSTMPSLVGPF